MRTAREGVDGVDVLEGKTHAQVLDAFPTPGVPRVGCPGEVRQLWTRPDVGQLGRAGDGVRPDAVHQVRLYRCAACGSYISLDTTAGRILNQYTENRKGVAS